MEINIKEILKHNIKQQVAWDNFFHHPEVKYMLYGGAAGGGKSYLLCLMHIVGSLLFKNTTSLIGRNTLANLKQTTLITFNQVLNDLKISDRVHYNANDMKYTFENGSTVVMYDLEYLPRDPDCSWLGSLNLSFASIDEINGIHPKVYSTLKTRIGRNNKLQQPIKIFMTCNPSKTWVYEEFYLPYKSDTLPTDHKFIQALPDDNRIYLGEEGYQHYETLTGYEREVFFLGNWEFNSNELQLIKQESIDNLFTNTYIQPTNKFYIVCDPARFGKDNCTIGIFNGNVLTYIWKKNKTSIPEIVEQINVFKNQYKVVNTNIIIDSDGVGGGVADSFVGCKNFHGGSKPLQGKYKNKRHENYFKLAEKINNNKLYCSITDKDIINQLKQELSYILRDDKSDTASIQSKDVIRKLIGRSPDMADLLMMFQSFNTETSKLSDIVIIY